MDKIKLNAQVQKLSHMFSLDGTVVPVINIFPPLEIPSLGRCIEKIPLDRITYSEDTDIANHDIIELTVIVGPKPELILKVLKRSGSPRLPLFPDRCPICGEPMVNPAPGRKFKRCVNRCCRGQMPATIVLMIAALGLAFQYPFKKVFDCLNSRGAFSSPVDIFLLGDDDFYFPNVSKLEVQTFQTYLHSIRGNTSLDRIINALRVPGWTDDREPFILRDYFNKNGWAITEFPRLFEPREQEKIKNINWDGFNELLTVENNKRVIADLCRILRL